MMNRKLTIYIDPDTQETSLSLLNKENYTILTSNEQLSDIEISDRGITILPDWNFQSIPFIFSKFLPIEKSILDFSENLKFEHYESLDKSIFKEKSINSLNVFFIHEILNNRRLSLDFYDEIIADSEFDEFAIELNKAIAMHYNHSLIPYSPDVVSQQFLHAAYLAPDSYWMAYTHYILMIFYIESQLYDEACDSAMKIVRRNLPLEAKKIVLLTLYNVLSSSELSDSYEEQLDFIEKVFSENETSNAVDINFLFAKSIFKELSGNEKEAKDSLQKALALSKNSNESLNAKAHQMLGDLYLKLAQKGQTHYYQEAQKSYQEALKVFKKATHPIEYADSQMNLGIIYGEMPLVDSRRHIYGSLCQAAFTESLHIYNKFEAPEQYAKVCTNFANALMRLLPSIDQDRFDKISFYLFEALGIRRKETHPEERAISLCSLMNLYIHRFEFSETIQPEWYDELNGMASEVLEISQNEFLRNMAHEMEKISEQGIQNLNVN